MPGKKQTPLIHRPCPPVLHRFLLHLMFALMIYVLSLAAFGLTLLSLMTLPL